MDMQKERDQLVESLAPEEEIIRGSLVRYVHEGCRCHPYGRYVYWYLSVNLGGKTRMRKLQGKQVPYVRKALQNYKQWWKKSLQIFELNTRLLLEQKEEK